MPTRPRRRCGSRRRRATGCRARRARCPSASRPAIDVVGLRRSRATVVGEVRAGDEARRAVGLGEVGQRPHRVADRRQVRLRRAGSAGRRRGSAAPSRPGRWRSTTATRRGSPGRARPRRSAAPRRATGIVLVQRAVREQVVDAHVCVPSKLFVARARRSSSRSSRARSSASASSRSGSIASSTIV